ncbi:chemotaxis protein CheA [Chitinivibrio alkaliphilus]|uniref:histidine kinase n=1 Tax=Chitinivibrio alkaliphilus ACht1 TaxID=1313304 RepID=U7D417_9BACT|nr:chemotaxis protein CheA [Chitinivibrio alkaliphilus]ERP31254.1 chemotaxis protein CheA [Chitinivibrio alkaliphilus ACht1]
MSNSEIDLDVLIGFIDEASDDLTDVSEHILRLEEEADLETIQAVFRVYHSLKGNASYFGLFRVKELAHALEQVLDKLRNNELSLSGTVIKTLLEGTSRLEELFRGVRENSGVEPAISVDDLLEKCTSLFASSGESLLEIQRELRRINTIHELKDLDRLITYIDSVRGETTEGHADTRDVQPQEGRSLPLIDTILAFFLEQQESDLLSDADTAWVEQQLRELQEAYQWNEGGKDLLESVWDDFRVCKDTVGLDPLMRSILQDKLVELNSAAFVKTPEAPRKNSSQEEPDSPQKISHDKTMRVKESTVDKFLSFVGELVIVEEMYRNFHVQLLDESLTREELLFRHKKITENFQGFSRMLRKSIMDIRKISIGKVVKRMPTIVREVADTLNKKIVTVIENGDIEIDKTLVEKIDAPLVHMVRNSADHGIELPEERKKQGKSPEGTIRITAEEVDGDILITVSDDGAGVDTDKIRDKAVSMGIITPTDTLTEEDILSVMFSSGVSTAETVTDISGRGVGMDVVKTAIESSGGSIGVHTVRGAGTTFTISLPASVTTQIIQGLVVSSAGERLVFPVETVVTTLSSKDAHIHSYKATSHMMPLDDEIIAVKNLADLTGKGPGTQDGFVVVVEDSSKAKTALQVDAIVGISQIVLKDIGEALQPDFIAGGAVMGDERVALVLDVDALCQS